MPSSDWWKAESWAGLMASALNRLMIMGPDRMFTSGGIGVASYELNEADYQAYQNDPIILIRQDGWTLGVTRGNKDEAYEQWADEWVAFIIPGHFENEVFPISQFNVVVVA